MIFIGSVPRVSWGAIRVLGAWGAFISTVAVGGGATRGQGDDALEQVRRELMRPTSVVAATAIDRDGLDGRVLCGYQGWFTAEGDGAGLGWNHWRVRDPANPDGWRPAVDMLPDVTELGPDERFSLPFAPGAGGTVEVYSAHVPATVHRHFRWMREYGIDGVFVQRFGVAIGNPRKLAHNTKVLASCRDGALENGRVYAVMYDLSGMKKGGPANVLADWRNLRERMQIGTDAAALQVKGKPLVAVWGIGFGNGREYTLAECRDLVQGLKESGCAVLCGVPTGWRTLNRDAVADAALHEVVALCDVVSPWTVGRYNSPDTARKHAERDWKADIEWCRERGITYLPVVFPGFSWHNLKGKNLAQIPRLGGRFLWTQMVEARRVGAQGLYVAMFDEVDEGTAIFKCAAPPPGPLADRFLGLEGLPSDYYLRLVGAAGEMLRGEQSSFVPPK